MGDRSSELLGSHSERRGVHHSRALLRLVESGTDFVGVGGRFLPLTLDGNSSVLPWSFVQAS